MKVLIKIVVQDKAMPDYLGLESHYTITAKDEETVMMALQGAIQKVRGKEAEND